MSLSALGPSSSRVWLAFFVTFALTAASVVVDHDSALAADLDLRGATYATASGSTPLMLTVPDGVTANDLLVAVVATNRPKAPTASAGWELLRTDTRGGEVSQTIWTRRATAPEPASYAWPGGKGRMTQTGALMAVSGADLSGLKIVSSGGSAHKSDPVIVPSLDVERDGALLLGAFSLAGTGSLKAPSTMTVGGSLQSRLSVTTAHESVEAGPTGDYRLVREVSGGAVGQLVVIERTDVPADDDEAGDEQAVGDGSGTVDGETGDGGSSGDGGSGDPDIDGETGTGDGSSDDGSGEGSEAGSDLDGGNTEDGGNTDPVDADHSPSRWSDAATWPSGQVPGSGDDVIVEGHIVIDDNATVETITVQSEAVLEFAAASSVTLEVTGNVVVEGTLRLRPRDEHILHRLRFVGIDEREFVGGHTHEPLPSDVGLWVVADGKLDAQGTPKAGWNRQGDHATWADDDVLRAAPIGTSTTEFPRFTRGSRPPTTVAPDGDVIATEVFNLTRNVIIEGGGTSDYSVLENDGRAHVMFLHCNQPQTIKYVTFRNLGPRAINPDNGRAIGVDGRYPLHFHRCQDGSRGSVVEGVTVESSGNRAFVPHASHGIAFRDTVAYDIFEQAYWWDPDTRFEYPANASHDILYERAAAFWIRGWPGVGLAGFLLGQGEGNACIQCVAAGVQGASTSAGFQWPESANHQPNVWRFEKAVAHNNKVHGAFVWQNDGKHHPIEGFVAYNNGGSGINHGAYLNGYHWSGARLWGNGRDVTLWALSPSNGNLLVFEDSLLASPTSIVVAWHALESSAPTIFRNNDIRGNIAVDESRPDLGSGLIEFVSDARAFDLAPSRFEVRNILSDIRVYNSDGTTYTVK